MSYRLRYEANSSIRLTELPLLDPPDVALAVIEQGVFGLPVAPSVVQTMRECAPEPAGTIQPSDQEMGNMR